MKKVFTIITIILVVATAGLCCWIFFKDIKSSQDLYNISSEYLNGDENNFILTRLSKCEQLYQQKQDMSNTQISSINSSIKNLIQEHQTLNTFLTLQNIKSRKNSALYNKTNKMVSARANFSNSLDEFIIKMNGNTFGNVKESFSYLLTDSVNFLSTYNSYIREFNIYVYTNILNKDIEYYLLDIQHNAISTFCDNYNNDVFYSNNIDFCSKYIVYNISNLSLTLSTSLLGGKYSSYCVNFINHYEKINKDDFASSLYEDIIKNPHYEFIDTDNDSAKAYYYLQIILGV